MSFTFRLAHYRSKYLFNFSLTEVLTRRLNEQSIVHWLPEQYQFQIAWILILALFFSDILLSIYLEIPMPCFIIQSIFSHSLCKQQIFLPRTCFFIWNKPSFFDCSGILCVFFQQFSATITPLSLFIRFLMQNFTKN